MTATFLTADEVERERLGWGRRGVVSDPAGRGATQLVVLDVLLEPGGAHDFHRHPDQEELLFVIEGDVEVWVDEEKTILGPGGSAFVPMDTVHASFNDSTGDVRLLAILGPCVGETGHTLVDMSTEEPWASLRL